MSMFYSSRGVLWAFVFQGAPHTELGSPYLQPRPDAPQSVSVAPFVVDDNRLPHSQAVGAVISFVHPFPDGLTTNPWAGKYVVVYKHLVSCCPPDSFKLITWAYIQHPYNQIC